MDCLHESLLLCWVGFAIILVFTVEETKAQRQVFSFGKSRESLYQDWEEIGAKSEDPKCPLSSDNYIHCSRKVFLQQPKIFPPFSVPHIPWKKINIP